MKKRILALGLALCLTVGILALPAGAADSSATDTPLAPLSMPTQAEAWDGRSSEPYAGGDGSQENPYQIANGAQLYYLALNSSSKTTYRKYFELTNNINLGDKLFTPIPHFEGIFDGKNFRILNLRIKTTIPSTEKSNYYIGLFATNDNCTYSSIQNLTVHGSIEVDASALASSSLVYVGGIIGLGNSCRYCVNECNITLRGRGLVGGIAGSIVGASVNYCINRENITATAQAHASGIAAGSDIHDCYNLGTIQAEQGVAAGITVNTYADATGDLVSGFVTRSVNGGTVISTENNAAGIACESMAYPYNYVGDSYNYGDIYGGEYAAGIRYFAGGKSYKDTFGFVRSSYNVGTISSKKGSADILYANNMSDTPKSTATVNCYYLQGKNLAANNELGGTALTQEEMESAGAFGGFDFGSVWGWAEEGEYRYPVLQWLGKHLKPCEHSYVADPQSSTATCTSSGTVTYRCTLCGDSYQENIPGLGHDYQNYTPDGNATCTEDGTKTGRCSRCGDQDTIPDVGSALGHSYGQPKFTWIKQADNWTATAIFPCEHSCGETQSVTATVTHRQTKPASCTDPGTMTYTAKVNFGGKDYTEEKTEQIDALGHDYQNYTPDGNATCTEDGTKTGKCSRCEARDTIPDVGSALGHSYGAPEFTWTKQGDDWTATALFTCEHSCGETQSVKATVTHRQTKPASCTDPGTMTYTAKVNFGGKDYTEEKTEQIEALGHDYQNYTPDGNATCTEDGTKTGKCSRCEARDTIPDVGSALGHSYGAPEFTWTKQGDDWTATALFTCEHSCGETQSVKATVTHRQTKPASCTDPGTMTYTAKVNFGGKDYTEEKTEQIKALGHDCQNYTSDGNATCTEDGTKTGRCIRCGKPDTVPDVGSALGHDCQNYTPDGNATCTEDGTKTGKCIRCGKPDTVPDVGSALGHDCRNYTADGNATCTKDGTKTGKCIRCGKPDTVPDIGSALGHSWDGGKVTKEPSELKEGETLYRCSRCGETRTEPIAKLVCDFGPSCPSRHLTDVPTDWAHAGIDYALRNGVMNGMENNQFQPETPMTRGMLVTVLWRYAGSPETGTSSFSDVPAGEYYAKAVAWAAKNGVVNGVGENRFDPEGNVTREQMATILYRYTQKLGKDSGRKDGLAAFPDAGAVSDYAKDAVGWAVAEGILNGSDGKLLPQDNATRAEVATILMRFIENILK